MKERIKISNYKPEWKTIFQEIEIILLSQIQNNIISIEHVGSTSVIALKAKPILDIDIVIENDEEIQDEVIKKLKVLGYIHRGNLGITGREAFKRENDLVPFTQDKKQWMAHNLYVCTKDSIGLNNHIFLRDYLREHPEAVKEYSSIKEDLVEAFPYNIDKYIEGKTEFITNILAKQGLDVKTLDLITKENLSK